MIEITEKIELYEYDELDEAAQSRALNHMIKMWQLMPDIAPLDAQPKIKQAIEDAERMQTPWFAPEYILEHCRIELEKELRTRWYHRDGEYYAYIDQLQIAY